MSDPTSGLDVPGAVELLKSVGPYASLAGNLFAAAMSRGNKQRQERLEKLFVDLSLRLSRIELKCSDETLADVFRRAEEIALSDMREDKLLTVRAVLKGTYCGEIDDVHSRLFMDLLRRFDVLQLHLLKLLRDTRGPADDPVDGIGFAFLDTELRQMLARESPEITDMTTFGVIDLMNSGLVHTRMNEESAGRIMIAPNPVGLIRKQKFSLSPLGRLFAIHVETVGNAPPKPV